MTKPMQASAPPSAALVAQLQTALDHQKNRRMEEAEKIFRRTVRDNPRNPEVLHLAALFFVQAGNYSYALSLLKKVVDARPQDAGMQRLTGEALYHTGDFEKASVYLKKALDINPADPEAGALMGLALHKMGQVRSAENYYRMALAKRETPEIVTRLSEILMGTGRTKDAEGLLAGALERGVFSYDTLVRLAMTRETQVMVALDLLAKAWQIDPGREEALSVLGTILSFGITSAEVSPRMEAVLMACLNSRAVNHIDLQGLWICQTFNNEDRPGYKALEQAKTYEDFCGALRQPAVAEILRSPLLIEGVRRIMACYLHVEKVLTFLRRHYLERIADGDEPDAEGMALVYALSSQCFMNEFVFDETPDETETIEALRKHIEDGQALPAMIAIFSCYRPLTGLKNCGQIPALVKNIPAAQEMVRMHVIEPQEEQGLKKSIKTIGRIADAVSVKVREQYEKNPYPRWNSFNMRMPATQDFIDRAYWKKGDILIAGCGTGKHVLGVCRNHPDMDILAVDLSTSSIAYAMRKCREYGIGNVKFMQGDILELGALNKKFQIIECAGVLHHMASPEAGLKVLTGLLADGGEMRLGLYSELARRDVVEVRRTIAEKGFPPTPEGIRACRAWIKESGETDFRFLKGTTDFYTLSACRDLIFHVQEVRYTIPGLKNLLDSAGMKFRKFKAFGYMMETYRREYPDDPEARNLDNWNAYEHKVPGLFGAMYQFSAVKKSPGE